MKDTDLKINIIDQIIHSQDDELIHEIQILLKLHDPLEDKITLTDPMLAAIKESEQQIEKGEFKESNDLWKEIDKWLDGREN